MYFHTNVQCHGRLKYDYCLLCSDRKKIVMRIAPVVTLNYFIKCSFFLSNDDKDLLNRCQSHCVIRGSQTRVPKLLTSSVARSLCNSWTSRLRDELVSGRSALGRLRLGHVMIPSFGADVTNDRSVVIICRERRNTSSWEAERRPNNSGRSRRPRGRRSAPPFVRWCDGVIGCGRQPPITETLRAADAAVRR